MKNAKQYALIAGIALAVYVLAGQAPKVINKLKGE